MPPMQSAYNPATSTLLYVEDDPDARLLFEMATNAARAQFRLRFAESVSEARDYLAGNGDYGDRRRFPLPVAILLDFTLAADSAVELLRWMRQTHGVETEVAIFSTSDDENQIRQCYAAGADYYLVKPTDYCRLVELVRVIDRSFHSNGRQRLFRIVMLREFRGSVHDVAVA
jgi:DNA-binding response OmpR family regulator